MIKNIIFDFDGVIHDSTEAMYDLNQKYSGFSREQTRNAFMGNIHDDKEIKKVNNDSFFTDMKRYYDGYSTTKETKDFLEANKDKKLAIVSSSDELIIEEYLIRNGVRRYFLEVLGYRASKSKVIKFGAIADKHGFSKEETIFITDTLGDVHEGNEFGIKTIGVTFGLHSREIFEQGDTHAICSSWSEVQEIIDNM